MIDHEIESQYTDYCNGVVNQCKEDHKKLEQEYDELYDIYVSYYQQIETLKEGHQKLQQKYDKLYDVCNNYYQSHVFNC